MGISLFDTHADTAYEMLRQRHHLINEKLHISLNYAKDYESYTQCMALWCDKELSDEDAYTRFFEMYSYLKAECERDGLSELCCTNSDIERAHKNGRAAFLIAVEDARLLSNKIERLDTLYEYGLRLLTFQWQGNTCIGGGFDTDTPLTDFGVKVAHRCAELGIIADISHACERTARDMIEIMAEHKMPVIATHSNSYAICAHKRNLTDALFSLLCECGGIAGISLAPQHLSLDSTATSENVFSHIEHYAEVGGIDKICLGCDFDGISSTPSDITDLRYLYRIAEVMLRHNYKEDDVKAVFSENARRFMRTNLR